jgi:hypothetical protein
LAACPTKETIALAFSTQCPEIRTREDNDMWRARCIEKVKTLWERKWKTTKNK